MTNSMMMVNHARSYSPITFMLGFTSHSIFYSQRTSDILILLLPYHRKYKLCYYFPIHQIICVAVTLLSKFLKS